MREAEENPRKRSERLYRRAAECAEKGKRDSSAGMKQRRRFPFAKSLNADRMTRPVASSHVAVMQILAGIDRFGATAWAFHFLATGRQLGSCGNQIVNQLSFPANFGVREARKAIAAINDPSRIAVPAHDRNVG